MSNSTKNEQNGGELGGIGVSEERTPLIVDDDEPFRARLGRGHGSRRVVVGAAGGIPVAGLVLSLRHL